VSVAEHGERAGAKGKRAGAKRPNPAHGKAKRTPRGANSKSLKSCILDVLGAEGVRVSDITRAVLEGGYKTQAASLDKSAAMACGELVKANLVKRTGRGLYAATGAKN